jgi:hypothetical protein
MEKTVLTLVMIVILSTGCWSSSDVYHAVCYSSSGVVTFDDNVKNTKKGQYGWFATQVRYGTDVLLTGDCRFTPVKG